jgi:VanZ family protein
MKAWLKRWGPAVLVMATIVLASSMPSSDLPEFGDWDTLAKKGGHLLGYALLAGAYTHALHRGRSATLSRAVASFCLAVVYAILDEWHQGFVRGRSSSVLDVVIDSLGSVIGLGVWAAIRRRFPIDSKSADA